ncbi:MAG: T9SS type A sorting domain-containing protein [Lewinellaceae bacterium]|nr:T9SS type A sorting domain-containing protein [Lewinellaceae bacterium]
MKLFTSTALLLLAFHTALSGQQLVSTTLLGAKTKTQLITQFSLPVIQYGAKFYRITYTTTNLQGLPDTVSGLVAVPDDPGRVYPRLVYQHGTSGSKLDVPSFNAAQGGEGSIGLLFAGMGYVALLPDYLGLGVSDGFHPYVHAASEASVAVDMLYSLPDFNAQYGVHTNEQLFLTGYSQGGHAAMALHREIQTNLSDDFTVTAAAHLSGPYSIGEVMRSLILSDSIYYYPAYLPNTILSYQTAYGNLFSQLTEVFKEPYATTIGQYYTGAISLNQLNTQLIASLIANEGTSRPLRALQPAIVQAVTTNPDHPFNVALRDNNVYAWAPVSPTRIFYCMADDQVPFLNSIVARDSMLARGAANLIATDVNSAADHGDCVVPALTNTVFFFAGFQQIGIFTATNDPLVQSLYLQPNPANTTVVLNDLPAGGQLRVTDLSGRLRISGFVSGDSRQIELSELENGLYFVDYETEGKRWMGKLVVQH